MEISPAASSNPYADAPRLPVGEALHPAQLVTADRDRLELEVGPGRGGFILERVAGFPDVAMVGLEIRRKWATIVDQRLQRAGLGARGRVFAEDARIALPRFAAGCFQRIFIHFPDPWWKKRHAKRRLATHGMLGELSRLLSPGGELFIQTDVDESAQAYSEVIQAFTDLQPHGDEPGDPRLAANPYGARSHRERRAIADGLPITRLRYRRPL